MCTPFGMLRSKASGASVDMIFWSKSCSQVHAS